MKTGQAGEPADALRTDCIAAVYVAHSDGHFQISATLQGKHPAFTGSF
jgi:hypothetical protein